jgi:hypothetical protein
MAGGRSSLPGQPDNRGDWDTQATGQSGRAGQPAGPDTRDEQGDRDMG